MVKFGEHINALAGKARPRGWDAYLPDYARLKSCIEGDDGFMEAWRAEHLKVQKFYEEQMNDIFSKLYKHLQAGSALVSADLWQLIEWDTKALLHDPEKLRSIADFLQALISFGDLSTTGLRKAAKKYAKAQTCKACADLFPQLARSNFAHDERACRASRALAKALAEASGPPNAATDAFEDGLRQEISTFKDIISETPEDVLKGLVAHRGFHSTKDSVTRPVENSLPAYEQAWAMGVHLCECDVNLTSDGWLVLNHDDNLDRLALNPGTVPSQRPVGDLSLREIVSSPLKSGVRPPLLKEILDSALVLGLPAQLVIELKPSSFIVGRALARFLATHRELLPHVAVVMSFDLYIMHEFAREFKHALGCKTLPGAGEGRPFMLLLTVLEAQDSFEVSLKLEEDAALDRVQKYVQSGGSALDGVYMEWSPRLLSDDADALVSLCQKFVVGVWQYAGQPDNRAQAAQLMQLGVRFVNTDLPDDFARPKEGWR